MIVGLFAILILYKWVLEWFGVDTTGGYSSPSPVEQEIREGIKAYDPNTKLSERDQQMIRETSRQVERMRANDRDQ